MVAGRDMNRLIGGLPARHAGIYCQENLDSKLVFPQEGRREPLLVRHRPRSIVPFMVPPKDPSAFKAASVRCLLQHKTHTTILQFV